MDSNGSGGNQGSSRPAAYLNFILFDENYNVLDAGWRPAPDVTFTKQKISFDTKEIKQEGYMFVYLSYDNDSPNWVFFDDFKVTHTKTNVIQYNEYYPFGLQTGNSWTRESSSNNFLYNGGSELNSNTGWYETFFRGYDADLGRFNQIDPLSYASSSHSPYNFAFNNPVLFNDPNGDYPRNTYIPMTFGWDDGGGGGGGGSLYPTFGPHQYGQHFYGAGSMNDWFNQYGGIERNARMMTRSNFNSFYHINGDQDRARVADNASTTIYSGGKWNLSAVTGYMTHSEDKDGNIVGDVYLTIDQAQQGGGGCPPGVDCDWVNGVAANGANWYGRGGQINWFIASSAAVGENLSGTSRIGNNLSLYRPTISGRVFQGNQYVNTFSISRGFYILGRFSFFAALTMDGLGTINYFQNPNGPNSVHPGKFGLNTAMGAFGLTGVGTVPSLLYFGVDSFYPGGLQGYSHQVLGPYQSNLHQSGTGAKIYNSTFH